MADTYEDLMLLWVERPLDTVLNEPDQAKIETAFDDLPESKAGAAYEGHVQVLFRDAQAALRQDLLARIHIMPFQFFEQLVIDVLLAMGYGARRRDLARCVGRSGDGGIDGIITLDELGLDQVFVQAKRLKPASHVAVSDVRDFAGSLEAAHANKGVFVTTGTFTGPARSFVAELTRRIVLVDGQMLADLMIRHNLGVRVKETYQIKMVDPAYFVVTRRGQFT